MASFYGIEFMAMTPISRFSVLEFLQSRHQISEENRLDRNKCPIAYLYHHQDQRPLTPVAHGHDHRFNRFLCLIPGTSEYDFFNQQAPVVANVV